MPALDISDGKGNFGPFAIHALRARMYHPTDKQLYFRQLSCSIAFSIAQELRGEEQVTIPSFILVFLLSAPSHHEVERQATQQFMYGLGTGELLHIILALKHNHPEVRPSLSKAWDLLSWHRKKVGTSEHSVAHLKKQWTHFKSVVHLWAALFYLQLSLGDEHVVDLLETRQSTMPDRPDDLKYFLAVAEVIRERGQEIRPVGGKRPLIEATEMWTVPADLELPRVEVHAPLLSEEQLRVLSGRKVPRRHQPETIE